MNWIDKAIGYMWPGAGLRRVQARARMELLMGYAGAKTGRREAGWITAGTSANAEIAPAAPKLRERAHDLTRNTPFAKRAVREWRSKVVGTGITPRADEKAMAIWRDWEKGCSAEGLPNFAAILRQVVGARFESGEVFLRKRIRTREDGLKIPMQLQVLEADFLDTSKVSALSNAGGYIEYGIEFDAIGRRVAYHMFSQHPGDPVRNNARKGSLESKAIPASEVIHYFDAERPGQNRGVSELAAVMTTMRDLDDWEDAELVRKKTESCLAAFITAPEDVALGARSTDAAGHVVEQFEPGMIARLKPGEEATINQPSYAGGYEDYKRSRVRDIAAGVSIPYEILRADLSQVNYSSYRSGLLSFRDAVQAEQWVFLIPIVCETVWRWVMESAVLAGRLKPADGIPPVQWDPPAFDLLDRLEEAKADELQLRIGTMTWPQAIGRQGEDPETQAAEIEEWKDRLKDAGVSFNMNAQAQQPNGGDNAQPPTN